MKPIISGNLIEKWLTGWSLSRDLPLPVKHKSGFKVEVNWEMQKERYVFPVLNEDFFQLAMAVEEPWIFLKVCAKPSVLKYKIPDRWIIQPQGYLMGYTNRADKRSNELPDGYSQERNEYNSVFEIRITDREGEMASTGRVVLVDDYAVFDRIETNPKHRRKGLATHVLNKLQDIADAQGIRQHILVATQEGKILYESLGWEVYSLYTSIVIPG
ncbi:GNAT family acetyltransferase [Elizabethkingia meningoseptica]|uniref:GNAT family N-acetyltransferase n=1 Tax=Elizabethkingia meningoseptica TaxID=238 RepID=UPI00099A7D0F|nr:GNAT family N-acetyltransferase [Elizabethkingia meningoseptica]OPC00104.1 GNAT family acetyltransferase [Elizabethkingia meningoseptica]